VEANAGKNRRAIDFVVLAVLLVTQRYCKHMFATVNQYATIEEAVFSVGAAPGLYNEDLTQLELEFGRVPELAVAAENSESRESNVIENNGKKGI
jgi:hypothetical protein